MTAAVAAAHDDDGAVDDGGLLGSMGPDATIVVICVGVCAAVLIVAAVGWAAWRRHRRASQTLDPPSPPLEGYELQPCGPAAAGAACCPPAGSDVPTDDAEAVSLSPPGDSPVSASGSGAPSPRSVAGALAAGAATAGGRVVAAAATVLSAAGRFGGLAMVEEEHERRAREAFARADADGDGKLSRKEVLAAVEDLPQLWAMLEVNTGIERSKCQEIAAAVAMCKLDCNNDGVLSWPEFRALWTSVLNDPKSQLEFFHRAMFDAFDADGNKNLDQEELAAFLEIFYKEGSIFSGDGRLPPKEELVHLAMSRLDLNKDRRLSFRELEPLLTGHMQIV